jgi:hypothetical protein
MKAILTSVYYLTLLFLLLTSAVVIPWKLSDSASIEFANAQLSALKAETGVEYVDLKDLRVREILDSGNKLGNEKFQKYSSPLSVVGCLIALVFAYFFKYASRYDPLVVLAVLAFLFFAGSIKLEYFIAIIALSLVAFYLKSRKLEQLPTDKP